VSRTSSFGHDIRCEVVGSEGSVFVRGAGDGAAGVIDRSDAVRFPPDYRARFADAYVAELTAFVAACTGAGPAGPTLDDDRRVTLARLTPLGRERFAEMARAHEEWVVDLLAGLSRREHEELLKLLAKLKASAMEVGS